MDVRYRQSFLRDLTGLKNQPVYGRIFKLAFETLPAANELREVSSVKAMKGYTNRFRIRVGSFRIGIEVDGTIVELVRVIDRRDFYRYFP